jgi:hypothetical protein
MSQPYATTTVIEPLSGAATSKVQKIWLLQCRPAMLKTDRAPPCRRNGQSPRGRDRHVIDFNRLTAGSHGPVAPPRKPGAGEASEHPPGKAVAVHKRLLKWREADRLSALRAYHRRFSHRSSSETGSEMVQ